MQFLFNTVALYYDTPIFYKISKITQNEFYAEPVNSNMKAFTFYKKSGEWISESGYKHRHALEIGEAIDTFIFGESGVFTKGQNLAAS